MKVPMTRRSGTNALLSLAALVAAASMGLHAAHPQTGAGATSAPSGELSRNAAADAATHGEVIDRYCVTCHDDRRKAGELVLEGLDFARIGSNADVWERVLRKLRVGMMPPPGLPRPDGATLDRLVSWLETSIDEAAAGAPNPGRPAVHRLNRLEYTNAIRDLLAIEVDGRSLLPADDAGFGFDNIGDALSVSPGLMERYLAAAEKISRLAVGDPTSGNDSETYSLSNMALLQEDRMSNDLPAGSRGGIAIRHYFPLDGEYLIKIQLQKEPQFSVVRGQDFPHQVDLRLDGVRVRLFPMETRGPTNPAAQTDAPADAGLKVRIPVKAGMRMVAVALSRDNWYVESVGPERLPTSSFAFGSGSRTDVSRGKQLMGVESVTIDGPFDGTPGNTPARQQLFVCRPATQEVEASCARRILGRLARRAFRRPARAADVERLFRQYETGREEGGFDAGIQRAIEATLVDPEFLFRVESDPAGAAPGTNYRISDLELASRLSFFLWSSIPDDELLDTAAAGRLKDPVILENQIRRMLGDGRSKAFLTSFFGQWLWLRNMATAQPDLKEFPEFDGNLREAFQRETELFLESQVREDRSVLELLTANYTFVNERLAKHYGIPHVYGPHFRRVTLEDDRRAGLLGQGAILTVTSYPNRTSPVVRGKWLLDTVLGAPPPPPPPNVPPFPEDTGDAPTTVRARMEQHRKNPACAACHAQLDPLGFALENFTAVGQWRSMEAGSPVDASGMLPSGKTFSGPAEFRQALMTHQDAFATNLTTRLLTYALGRGVESFDMPAVRQILREAATQDYRWSSFVVSIVKSLPFQMRRARS